MVKTLQEKYDYNFHIIKLKDKLCEKEMINFMLKCDIAISGGGQTTYELARCGIPTIGICYANNQLLNLKYGEKAGYLKFAGWFENKHLLYNIKRLFKSFDYVERSRMNIIGKKLVDGQGGLRIVNKLIKEYEYTFSH